MKVATVLNWSLLVLYTLKTKDGKSKQNKIIRKSYPSIFFNSRKTCFLNCSKENRLYNVSKVIHCVCGSKDRCRTIVWTCGHGSRDFTDAV